MCEPERIDYRRGAALVLQVAPQRLIKERLC